MGTIGTIVGDLVSLAVSLFLSYLVWRHYKDSKASTDERYHTFWPRLFTGWVDSCVLWPVIFIANVLLCLNLPRVLAAILICVQSIAWLIYTVIMHGHYGQTIGKMVTKVRVVDYHTESQISFRQAWLREGIPAVLDMGFIAYWSVAILTRHANAKEILNGKDITGNHLVMFLTFLPGLWFLVEVLTMLTNEKRRALHDFIAGTVVVRTNLGEKSEIPISDRALQTP